jgi:hypothetical protein
MPPQIPPRAANAAISVGSHADAAEVQANGADCAIASGAVKTAGAHDAAQIVRRAIVTSPIPHLAACLVPHAPFKGARLRLASSLEFLAMSKVRRLTICLICLGYRDLDDCQDNRQCHDAE